MKNDHLKQMYDANPEIFRLDFTFTPKRTEKRTMKHKIKVRTVFIVSAILILLTAVAYAVFSSQVTAF